MSRYSWIRNLFASRSRVKTPARVRLTLETLEERATPAVVGLSAPEVYVEDTALNLTDIVISGTGTATATLTLSNPAAGSLNTATSGTVTSTYNAATGVWTATGPITDVNVLLAGLTYTPSLNFNTTFDITTSVTDADGTFTGDKSMTGTPVNDQPIANPQSFTTNEDTPFSGTLTGDDGDPEVTQTLTFAIASQPSHGTLTINAASGTFTYTPAANYNGPDSFTFTVTDDATAGGPALTSVPATASITVNAVNDAPVLTVPGPQTTPEDVALKITGISVSDVDVKEGTGQIKIVLLVTSGTLSVGTSIASGLTATQISGNGTNTIVLQGPIDNVNATLAAGVTYLGNLNFNGNDTLTVHADDLGNTGAGGPQTADATVPIHVLSPAEQVANLRQMVQSLADAGAFKNHGRLNALLTKLNQIDAALERGQGKVAYNVAGAFLNQIRAFRSAGILTAAQAAPLITAATQLRTSLSVGGFAVTSSSATSTSPSNGHGANNVSGASNGPGSGSDVVTSGPGNGHGNQNGKGHGK
jgi:VCBS repeat-containing protein